MPPLSRRDVKSLVIQLSAHSRPVQQSEALVAILHCCRDSDDAATAFSAAGVIPPLVQLLGHGAPAEVQTDAMLVLGAIALGKGNAVDIATAIPSLVRTLGPASTGRMQVAAVAALNNLSLVDANAVTIASAGAIPHLVQLLGPAPQQYVENASTAEVQQYATNALYNLALYAEIAVTIADAGAIPLLVQLLGSGSPAAAGVLMHLAARVEHNAVTIAAAGAIPRLVQLLGRGNPPSVQRYAAGTLACLLTTGTRSPSPLLEPSLFWCSYWGLALLRTCRRMQQED
jgi:hypothetical protein